MVIEIYWTKTDPNNDKILVLITRLSKIDKNKKSALATVQLGRGNRTQTLINTKGRDTNHSYVEVLKILNTCVSRN